LAIVLKEADLYEAPLTSFGRNAVDRFFTPDDAGREGGVHISALIRPDSAPGRTLRAAVGMIIHCSTK
jgi:hypothetical protein